MLRFANTRRYFLEQDQSKCSLHSAQASGRALPSELESKAHVELLIRGLNMFVTEGMNRRT